MTPRARKALGLLVLLQIAHSVEEYFGRLWESFPPARAVSGLISSDLERGFVIFNVALIIFGLWCWLWPVRLGWRIAIPLAWVLVVIGIINGIGHPLWSISRGGYTPGVATAALILVVSIYLAGDLLGYQAVMEQRRSKMRVQRKRRGIRVTSVLKGHTPAEQPPYHNELPLLTPSHDVNEREWLQTSMITFARNVASFLPGHFDAYVRIYHPFENGSETGLVGRSWSELAAEVEVELTDPEIAAEFAYHGVDNAQAYVGQRPQFLVEPLIENLRGATNTPDRCFFAIWEGFSDSVAEDFVEPMLKLPWRNYHVFEGPVEASRTSFSEVPFMYTAANLWWPADRAWFVSTEVDFAWTYVGGSRSLIDALLEDPRLDSVETFATARW